MASNEPPNAAQPPLRASDGRVWWARIAPAAGALAGAIAVGAIDPAPVGLGLAAAGASAATGLRPRRGVAVLGGAFALAASGAELLLPGLERSPPATIAGVALAGGVLLAEGLTGRLRDYLPFMGSCAGVAIGALGGALGAEAGAARSDPAAAVALLLLGAGLTLRAHASLAASTPRLLGWAPLAAGALLPWLDARLGLSTASRLGASLPNGADAVVLLRAAAGLLFALFLHGVLVIRSRIRLLTRRQADLEQQLTSEREAQRRRRDTEALLRLALDASALGIAWWDARRDRIELDARAREILGVAPSGPPRSSAEFYSLVHPDDLSEVQRRAIASRFGSPRYELRYRVLRPKGGVRHIQTQALRLRDDQGETTAVAAVVADVTEQRLHEEALLDREDRLRRAVEEAPFPIMLHAEDGAVLLINRAWSESSGYTEVDLPTVQSWIELAHGKAAAEVSSQIRSLYCLEERVSEGTHRITTRAGGERLWEFHQVPLGALSDGRRFVMSCAVDVTDRDLAMELARSHGEIETLAYVASHDLQQPLRMIISFLQLLARRYQGRLDEDADRYIRFAVDGATRMQRLLHDLLAYSRAGRMSVPESPIETHEAVNEALANLRAAIEETGAEIVVEPLPHLRSNQVQLVAVFQNLLENAIKYRGADVPRIAIGGERGEEATTIWVRDNGMGFHREQAERIFLPFQRLHESSRYPGSGVGLAIVHRIVTRAGGRVWADSELGRGSTFFLQFPNPHPHLRDRRKDGTVPRS